MALMQRRAAGFAASTASTICRMQPLLPPMKTASGAGSPASAAGARPSVRYRLATANFARFCRISAQASGSHSTAQTRPAGAASAISTLTLPVPAPTSHSVSPGRTASFASTAARTSCLVIGVLPRRKASSGQPGTRAGSGGHGSTKSTLNGANSRFAIASTVSVTRRSAVLPRFSPTVAFTCPHPASANARQSVAGVSLPPVRKKTGFPVRQTAAGSQRQP